MTDNRDHEEKLGGEQTVSKTKNTIFRQFMRPLTVFRIILILFLFLAMFCFTTYRTWSEKKQFSQDISDYVAFSLGDYECITQLTEYMHDHFSEMELVYDEEQLDYKEIALSLMIENYTVPEKITPKQFNDMSDESKKLCAEVCYAKMSQELDELRQYYGISYISADMYSDGQLFTIARGVEVDEKRISEGGEESELGTAVPYEKGAFAALDKLLGISPNAVSVPFFDATEGGAVYTFSAVKDADGKVLFAVTSANEWTDHFMEAMGFTLFNFVIVLVLLIFEHFKTRKLLSKVVVEPIRKEQDILNDYIRHKQAEKTVAALSEIRSDNEIQSLAENFSYMAKEIERYVGEVREVTAEKERIGAELDVAAKIQADMLPSVFPPFPERKEFDIYATMTPAKEVGGDFYDFFFIDDDHLALVMADVSGKGIPASLFMVNAKTIIKNKAQSGELSPAKILMSANEQLCEGNDAELFVTVWLAVIELSTGKGKAANAGHEHPTLRRKDGKYELVVYRHSPAVATMEGMRFREHDFELFPGDSLFVYTDGVAEATDANDKLYGTDRMLEALNKDPDTAPKALLTAIRASVDEFVGEAPQFDDLTMLGFTYHGPQE